MATLKRSDAGLVEAARQSAMEEGTNLLLVVDQFEEVFRFHEAGSIGAEEAPDFVQLLLEGARNDTLPVYIVLTMRSDFLGDCSRFAGLAEAVNNGEYLIPRLDRTNYLAFRGEHVHFSPAGNRLAVSWSRSGVGAIGEVFLPTVSIFEFGTETPPQPEPPENIVSGSESHHFVRLNSDGGRIVMADSGGRIQSLNLDEPSSWNQDKRAHIAPIRHLTYSRDGLLFASGDDEGVIGIWDAHTGEHIHYLRAHADAISDLRFSPDGTKLLSLGGRDKTFKTWDVATGEAQLVDTFSSRLGALDSTPNGDHIVVGDWSNRYSVYDARTLKRRFMTQGPHGAGELHYLPDGESFVARWYVSEGDFLSLCAFRDFQIETRSRIGPPLHDAGVSNVSVSPRGDRIATAHKDGVVKVWEKQSDDSWQESSELRIRPHDGAATWVEFDPSGRLLATATDSEVRLWNSGTGELDSLIDTPEGATSLAFSLDGQFLLVGDRFGMLELWSISEGISLEWAMPNIGDSTGHWFLHGARSVALAPSRGLLFTPGPDTNVNTIQVWEMQGGDPAPVATLSGSSRPGLLAVTPDENMLVSAQAYGSGPINVWDLDSRILRKKTEPTPGAGSVAELVITPDGRTIAVSCFSRPYNVYFWDVETGERVGQTSELPDNVDGIAFTPDNRRLITGSGNHITLWDFDPETRNTRLVQELSGTPTTGEIHRLSVSPDGRHLSATTGRDASVYLWDLQTLEPLGHPISHDRSTFSVAFSPDGRLIASGGGGLEIRISTADSSRQLVAVLSSATDNGADYITDLEFTASGRRLVASTNTGEIQIWRLESLGRPADVTSYIQLLDLDTASGELAWRVASESLEPPTRTVSFAPIPERYLESLETANSMEEKRIALSLYYLREGLDLAALAALEPISESIPDAMWPRIHREIVGRVMKASRQDALDDESPSVKLAKIAFGTGGLLL